MPRCSPRHFFELLGVVLGILRQHVVLRDAKLLEGNDPVVMQIQRLEYVGVLTGRRALRMSEREGGNELGVGVRVNKVTNANEPVAIVIPHTEHVADNLRIRRNKR